MIILVNIFLKISGELVSWFKNILKTKFVEPKKFSQDLLDFYMSKFLTNELREFFTAMERKVFYQSFKNKKIKARTTCQKNWPICYKRLEKNKMIQDISGPIFRSSFVMSNFQFDYFSNKRINGTQNSNYDSSKEKEDDLLIERQRHICSCKDEELNRKKSEFKSKISQQISNYGQYLKAIRVEGGVDYQSSSDMKERKNSDVSHIPTLAKTDKAASANSVINTALRIEELHLDDE